jgi:hypothetical protein
MQATQIGVLALLCAQGLQLFGLIGAFIIMVVLHFNA